MQLRSRFVNEYQKIFNMGAGADADADDDRPDRFGGAGPGRDDGARSQPGREHTGGINREGNEIWIDNPSEGRIGYQFYWKLFADREKIACKKNGALVFNYGKNKGAQLLPAANLPQPKNPEVRKARDGQGKYREALLAEMFCCPITRINDERLLIASHIKPWIESNEKEKVDPKNGLILSPLFDKLFDRGFITFTDDKFMVLSNWITPKNYERMGLNINDHKHYELLPFDEARLKYLLYHREKVFKG